MIVKFDFSLNGQPALGDVKGHYHTLYRESNYRTINMSEEDAIKVFTRVADYLKIQMEAHRGANR